MAASDRFTIDVKGRGGHGAAPQQCVDAVVEAASVVVALQTIVSRSQDPLESGVVTCGFIKGGYGFNIIADSVQIGGTTRSFSSATQDMIEQRMRCICQGVATTFGGQIDLDYVRGYPPTVNSYPQCNAVVVKAATKVVGAEKAALPQKTMGAEDFSYFLQEKPGLPFLFPSLLHLLMFH
jgi:amidohydrolase